MKQASCKARPSISGCACKGEALHRVIKPALLNACLHVPLFRCAKWRRTVHLADRLMRWWARDTNENSGRVANSLRRRLSHSGNTKQIEIASVSPQPTSQSFRIIRYSLWRLSVRLGPVPWAVGQSRKDEIGLFIAVAAGTSASPTGSTSFCNPLVVSVGRELAISMRSNFTVANLH